MKKKHTSWIVFWVALAVAAALALLTQGTFLSPRNLTNLTRQVAINGILAVGMTYVILIGGIDLSLGSVVALSGVIVGLLQVNAGVGSPLLSIVAAMAVGVGCGLFNGWWITRHRIAPFIVTLGMMVIARGVALILAKGAAIAPLGEAFGEVGQGYLEPTGSVVLIVLIAGGVLAWAALQKRWRDVGLVAALGLGFAYVFASYRGLPYPVLIFFVIAALGYVILERTRVGRFVLALGGSPDAAWLAGVPVRQIAYSVYVVMGGLAGLSGALLAARLNGALPTAGELFELDAIAAVVIGGTSLLGGVGSVQGSVMGAFFIGILNNGMSLLDVTEFYQKVIKGVIIILAVWIDVRQKGQRSAH